MTDSPVVRAVDAAAIIQSIARLPFGLQALACYLAAEAEIGPLTSNFEDLLLDNFEGIMPRQAKEIAALYRQLPHVVRAISEESRQAAETIADDNGEQRCSNPGGHEFECTGTAYGGDDERWMGEGRMLCIYCGADGDG